MSNTETDMLLYGFGPYKGVEHNITEQISDRVRNRDGLVKVIFPVEFNEQRLLDEVAKWDPKAILGMGHFKDGRYIRIERKAVNLIHTELGEEPKEALPGYPKELFVTANLTPDKRSKVSHDAEMAECNFSMLVMSKYAEENGVLFAFLHIPGNFSIEKAVGFVEEKIDEMIALLD